jgi:ribosomal protein S4E
LGHRGRAAVKPVVGPSPQHPLELSAVTEEFEMAGQLKDGATCKVVGGTHKGKTGTVRDVKTSKTGHVTITVIQKNGERFKTLARNVVV